MALHKLDKRVYFAQKAFIEKDGKVLVLRDPDYVVDGQTGLDLPGGKYRWGQDLEKELKREVKEETNLEIELGEPLVVWTYFGDKRKGGGKTTHTVLVGYACKYKSGKVILSDEHDGYEWVDKSTYEKWADKTDSFRALKEYFKIKGT